MRNYFAAAAAFARDVTVREGTEERPAKAIIQPLSVTAPEYAGRPTVMGTVDDRRYLLIAEPAAISDGEDVEISCDGKTYRLLRCEMLGGGSHWEGIMRLKAGDEDVQ